MGVPGDFTWEAAVHGRTLCKFPLHICPFHRQTEPTEPTQLSGSKQQAIQSYLPLIREEADIQNRLESGAPNSRGRRQTQQLSNGVGLGRHPCPVVPVMNKLTRIVMLRGADALRRN